MKILAALAGLLLLGCNNSTAPVEKTQWSVKVYSGGILIAEHTLNTEPSWSTQCESVWWGERGKRYHYSGDICVEPITPPLEKK